MQIAVELAVNAGHGDYERVLHELSPHAMCFLLAAYRRGAICQEWHKTQKREQTAGDILANMKAIG